MSGVALRLIANLLVQVSSPEELEDLEEALMEAMLAAEGAIGGKRLPEGTDAGAGLQYSTRSTRSSASQDRVIIGGPSWRNAPCGVGDRGSVSGLRFLPRNPRNIFIAARSCRQDRSSLAGATFG